MAFDWQEYLSLSRLLLSQKGSFPNEEAVLRSAVSRAYFSAFCYARNYALTRQGFYPTKRAEDHGDLKLHFRSRGMNVIVSKLDELRQWRNLCDYDDTTNNLEVMAKNAISRAEYVINKLN